jgi:hypothetical protein
VGACSLACSERTVGGRLIMLDVSPVSFVCRLRQHARIHLLIASDMKRFHGAARSAANTCAVSGSRSLCRTNRQPASSCASLSKDPVLFCNRSGRVALLELRCPNPGERRSSSPLYLVLDWISRIDLLIILVTAICCRNFQQTCGIKRVLKRPAPVRLGQGSARTRNDAGKILNK